MKRTELGTEGSTAFVRKHHAFPDESTRQSRNTETRRGLLGLYTNASPSIWSILRINLKGEHNVLYNIY